MKNLLTIILVFILANAYGQCSITGCIIDTVTSDIEYAFGQYPSLAHDGDTNTFYMNSAEGGYGVDLTLTLTKTVKAARIVIKANKPGIKLGNYSSTFTDEDEIIYVNPNGFSAFHLTSKVTYIRIYEVEAYEIPIGSAGLEYAYNTGGNMMDRTMVIGSTKSGTINEGTDPTETEETAFEKVYTDKLGETEVRIYPNPTKGQLTVDITNPDNQGALKVKVCSLNGKLIYKSTSNSNSINLEGQPDGLYILEVSLNGKSGQWRIIKK